MYSDEPGTERVINVHRDDNAAGADGRSVGDAGKQQHAADGTGDGDGGGGGDDGDVQRDGGGDDREQSECDGNGDDGSEHADGE